ARDSGGERERQRHGPHDHTCGQVGHDLRASISLERGEGLRDRRVQFSPPLNATGESMKSLGLAREPQQMVQRERSRADGGQRHARDDQYQVVLEAPFCTKKPFRPCTLAIATAILASTSSPASGVSRPSPNSTPATSPPP